MDPTTLRLIQGAAGASGDKIYVDDVFSTDLWEGSSSQVDNENGIDLSTEGGLVWIKNRSYVAGRSYVLFDTERGPNKVVSSNNDSGQNTLGATGTLSFNTDGYDIPSGDGDMNGNGFGAYCGWTFRKAPGFFDVVTYTGNGTTQNIPHSLDSVPGMIIVKRTNGTGDWFVYHRSVGANKAGRLNADDQFYEYTSPPTFPWNNTTPTSTEFSVSANATYKANTLNETYVAYIFAHDDARFGTAGNQSIINCGSLSLTSGNITYVNLGFEPQWLLVKKTSTGQNWQLFDMMRGFVSAYDNGLISSISLTPNSDARESGLQGAPLSDGFGLDANNWGTGDYMYMAIRRPHKPPTAATEVFGAATQVPPFGNQGAHRSGFVADMAIRRRLLVTTNNYTSSRLLAGSQLSTNTIDAESAEVDNKYDYMNGYFAENDTSTDKIAWLFKRAPGFFDVVSYIGDGASSRNVPHNLGSAPELVIVKRVDPTGTWVVWSDELSSGYILQLNGRDAEINVGFPSNYINSSTSTTFNIGSDSDVNANSNSYIAYLFGTLPGISKVGKYLGTGNDINVDCGFSSGARFILIRRFSPQLTLSDWYVYDTTRGIAFGDDPYILLNSNAQQVSNTDYIDPLASGFTVTSSAPDELNVDGGTYLFLAIA